MADSRRDAVRRIMADVFHLEPTAIDDKSAYGTIEAWDSQNHVRLILALEEEFNVSFDVSEIEAMTSFGEVVAALERKL